MCIRDRTIGGLACGKPIKGKVAFLGGPLYFLSELRARFIETLSLSKENTILPENSQLFVAMGAALASESAKVENLEELISKLENSDSAIHCDNAVSYTHLPCRQGIDAFVKLGRVLKNGKFVELTRSNVISIPRNSESWDTNIIYSNVSYRLRESKDILSKEIVSNLSKESISEAK